MLCSLLPVNLSDNFTYGRLCDSVEFPQFSLGNPAFFVSVPNFLCLGFGYFMSSVALSMRVSLFFNLVVNIVLVSPKKQVTWIHAGRVVASMEYVQVLRKLSVSQSVCNAMGARMFSVPPNQSITLGKFCSHPKPAPFFVRGFVNIVPKGVLAYFCVKFSSMAFDKFLGNSCDRALGKLCFSSNWGTLAATALTVSVRDFEFNVHTEPFLHIVAIIAGLCRVLKRCEAYKEHLAQMRAERAGRPVSIVVYDHDAATTLKALAEVLSYPTLIALGNLIGGA